MSSDILQMSKSGMQGLASTFAGQQTPVMNVVSAIDSALESTTWEGARAMEFRRLWNDEFKKSLTNLHDALGEHSTFITRELDQGVRALDTVGG